MPPNASFRSVEITEVRCRLLTEPFCPENGAGEKRAGNALQLLFYLGENRRRANPERLKRTRIRAHVFLQVEDVRPDKLFLNVGIMLQMFFSLIFSFFEFFLMFFSFVFLSFVFCVFQVLLSPPEPFSHSNRICRGRVRFRVI